MITNAINNTCTRNDTAHTPGTTTATTTSITNIRIRVANIYVIILLQINYKKSVEG